MNKLIALIFIAACFPVVAKAQTPANLVNKPFNLNLPAESATSHQLLLTAVGAGGAFNGRWTRKIGATSTITLVTGKLTQAGLDKSGFAITFLVGTSASGTDYTGVVYMTRVGQLDEKAHMAGSYKQRGLATVGRAARPFCGFANTAVVAPPR